MSDSVYYLVCGVLTLGVLGGIAMLSRVQSAVRGNLLSAFCTAAAVMVTLYKYEILSDYALWVCVAAGSAAGLAGAYRVRMIQMPQVVALLNGFGGAASALVAAAAVLETAETDLFFSLTAALALAVGMITLTGSLVAGGKLHKILSQRPVIWRGHRMILAVDLLLTAASVAAMAVFGGSIFRGSLLLACAVFSGFFGVAFAVRVGGADMPITISLLNSLSGVAGGIAGMAVSDPLLVAVGGVVGASGLLLTQIMCRSINRSLADILLGKTSVQTAPEEAAPAKPAPEAPPTESVQETLPQDPAAVLTAARKVIMVPGYGMALAQAQSLVKELADRLEAAGKEVLFAIHPVAGRMPGHMNVLLCEVDVPYEKLHEMEEINPQFSDCDAAVIIGANDVVNPAANTAEGTPIYGMPVLDADKARHIIILNYDTKPGYAGVENPLYSRRNATLLLGDAKETLRELLDAL
jgi:NAD(P) transhydrogenase subunit beta